MAARATSSRAAKPARARMVVWRAGALAGLASQHTRTRKAQSGGGRAPGKIRASYSLPLLAAPAVRALMERGSTNITSHHAPRPPRRAWPGAAPGCATQSGQRHSKEFLQRQKRQRRMSPPLHPHCTGQHALARSHKQGGCCESAPGTGSINRASGEVNVWAQAAMHERKGLGLGWGRLGRDWG